jgi:hypothetical protein
MEKGNFLGATKYRVFVGKRSYFYWELKGQLLDNIFKEFLIKRRGVINPSPKYRNTRESLKQKGLIWWPFSTERVRCFFFSNEELR